MILIAHRGLINGPDSKKENTEFAISVCLIEGYNVEVDLWLDDNEWYLGHDAPTYKTSLEFITQKGLWIHCKNVKAANELRMLVPAYRHLNYFWHESDERVLTSQGYWWTYPNKELGIASIALMPEWYTETQYLSLCKNWNCAGICSDYVSLMR